MHFGSIKILAHFLNASYLLSIGEPAGWKTQHFFHRNGAKYSFCGDKQFPSQMKVIPVCERHPQVGTSNFICLSQVWLPWTQDIFLNWRRRRSVLWCHSCPYELQWECWGAHHSVFVNSLEIPCGFFPTWHCLYCSVLWETYPGERSRYLCPQGNT